MCCSVRCAATVLDRAGTSGFDTCLRSTSRNRHCTRPRRCGRPASRRPSLSRTAWSGTLLRSKRRRDKAEQCLSPAEKELFRQQDADATAAANIVHGFEWHRSAVIPLQSACGGSTRTRSKASFALPKKDAESEPELVLILDVINDIFTETHSCLLRRAGLHADLGPNSSP
jgi:hypothetical protein